MCNLPKQIESDIVGDGLVKGELSADGTFYRFLFFDVAEKYMRDRKIAPTQSLRMNFMLWGKFLVNGSVVRTWKKDEVSVVVLVRVDHLIKFAEKEVVEGILTADPSLIPTCDRSEVLNEIRELVECADML